MDKYLMDLYLAFEYMDNKKVTSVPLYRMDTSEILTGLAEALNKRTSHYPLTKQQVRMMKHHLQQDDGLFYYKKGIERPFRIDNTRYIEICDDILAYMEKDPYYDDVETEDESDD